MDDASKKDTWRPAKTSAKTAKGAGKNIGNVDRNQALKSTTFPIKANLYLFKNTNYFLNAFNIQLLKEIQLWRTETNFLLMLPNR